MSTIRWEDLVFTNRNQSYGAYLLRKAYPGRVNLSFVFAMITVTLILASPSIKAMLVGKHASPPVRTPGGKPIEWIDLPPIEIPSVPPPKVDLSKFKTERFVPPKVTDTEVDDVIPTNAELSQANIPEDNGDGVTFVEGPAVVDLPAAVEEKKEEIYTWVEIAPEFPGGYKEMMKFIGKNIKYPAIARRMNIEGPVYISFVVDADGTITNVKTDKGISGGCDEEAMRVVAMMPKWKPGRQGGNAVKVRFVLPIKFALGGA